MKTRRTIYIILGSFFILVNIMIDIINPDKSPMTENEGSYGVGYFIGSHFLMIFGLIFLGLAFKVHKKIKRVRSYDLEKDIDQIGNN